MKSYCVLTLSKYPDHLDRCLSSIFIAQPGLSFEDVYVVDDGLPPDTRKRWKVNYIEGKKPFSFAQNFNIGISQTPQDRDIFFIGDDGKLMTHNGIDRLATVAAQNPVLGIVAPSITGLVKNFFQTEGVVTEFTYRENIEGLPGYLPTVVFYAVYLTRKATNLVGPIPETLSGYGYEDDYFCEQMIRKGLEWAIDPSVLIQHGFGKYQSASSYYRAGLDPFKLQEINRKIYEDFKKQQLPE